MTRQVTLPFSPANFTRSALNSSLATAESIAASSEPLVIELCTKATQTETSVLEKRGREEFEAMAKELEAKDRELEELRAFKRAHEAKSESSDDDDDDDDEEPAPKRAKSDDAKKRSSFAGVTFHTRENKWEVRAPKRGIERVESRRSGPFKNGNARALDTLRPKRRPSRRATSTSRMRSGKNGARSIRAFRSISSTSRGAGEIARSSYRQKDGYLGRCTRRSHSEPSTPVPQS